MHGRVKVRTTEEQEEIKRKEREKKVQVYREITAAIYEKRKASSTDDEALKLTEKILIDNSDMFTMWNYRREIILSRLKELSPEDSTKICYNELHLLERCLRGNPKAYCVWLHRRWILEQLPSPPLNSEIDLCNLFLKYDERNFHCWDYRRHIVKLAKTSPEKELAFSHDKISSNFSNYSAWHYRSKLLPVLCPSAEGHDRVDDETLREEFQFVQNAFYTDPNDQSAWFYHKWLVGRGKKPLALSCLLIRSRHIYLSFNQPVQSDAPVMINVCGVTVQCPLNSDWSQVLLECSLPCDVTSTEQVVITRGDFSVSVALQQGENCYYWIGDTNEMFKESVAMVSQETLLTELSMCRELLELEPNNKWCILRTLQLLEMIDPVCYHIDIMNLLDTIIAVDPYRKGYYCDMRSRHVVEYTLRNYLANFSPEALLDLSYKGLTKLYYTECMILCKNITLEGNKLSTPIALKGLGDLKQIEILSLANNGLQELPDDVKNLKSLQSLSLANNCFLGNGYTSILDECTQLINIDLTS